MECNQSCLQSKSDPWEHNIKLILNVNMNDILLNIYYEQSTLLWDLG